MGGKLGLLVLLVACGSVPKPEACTPRPWYADADGDGFGDDADVLDACAAEGRVDVAGDCDDGDSAVFPGASEACDAASDMDCDGVVPWADGDADGWASCLDCDDADATIFPAAAEVCDGVDQDCDDEIDEDAADALAVYVDADGDGYGDPATTDFACAAEAGWSLSAGDCDDGDAAVNPDAIEACNAADDDCDGTVDDVEDLAPWYDDLDGDGWGDATTATRTCEPAGGQVDVSGDCDDSDADISPDAVEVCGGADEDCDGDVDEDDAIDAESWYFDGDGDSWGDPASVRYACDQPVTWIARGADCDDTSDTVWPGADELCNRIDDDCDLDVDEPDAIDATTWYADTDGDGWGGAELYAIGCDAPPDHYASSEDCDDGDAAVSPDADERCDGVDNDCDGATDEDSAIDATTWYADADGDGYGDSSLATLGCDGATADGTDCDDADAAISPGAAEVCDGVDQDCDGAVDDDATDAGTWYTDADGDGWGDNATAVLACTDDALVSAGGDCDDADDATHPDAAEDCGAGLDTNCDGFTGTDDADGDGAVACEDCDDGDPTRSPTVDETCDGRDQDCDGRIDEEPVDGATWYTDLDGDGYGDPANPLLACSAPAGALADATDCDDADAAVSPAALETCVTAADDDCSGTPNDDDAVACTDWYLDFDGDGSGSLSARCLCDADAEFSATDSDDCDDGNAAISPDLDEVWANGVDDDCDTDLDTVSLDTADRVIYGEAGQDAAGTHLAGVGDADGDGLDDFLVGAPGVDTNGSGSGAAYLVVAGEDDLDLSGAYATLLGADAGDAVSAVAGGDLDGDGFADLFVGASEVGSSVGAAYLVRGPAVGTLDLAAADTTLVGESLGDKAGGAVALGDFDADGVGDLVVAGTGDDDGGSAAGAVWAVYVPASAGIRLSAADVKLVGEDASDHAGAGLDAGDFDGDGIDDLFVGATGDDDAATDAGAVYLLLGPLSGWADLSAHDGKYIGEAANDEVGDVVRLAGDLDGDGLRDLVIGAPGNGLGGGAWAFAGPGAYAIHRTAEAFASWSADELDDDLGASVVCPGDLDRDSQDDFVIGAPGADISGTSSGAAYVYFGPFAGAYVPDQADSILYGGAASDYAGRALAAPGDTDGDGIPDLLVGATGVDDGGSSAGAALLLLGPG